MSVHPRIRGERFSSSSKTSTRIGSSPHTRGTLLSLTDRVRRPRFIPAYAGNAAQWSSPVEAPAVHPRIRGERQFVIWRPILEGGSSPHTRGTHLISRTVLGDIRFIPAYAGNASLYWTGPSSQPVHPRIRGERYAHTTSGAPAAGSSPHTRGTQLPYLLDLVGRRFIPAYAGNADPHWRGRRYPAVHPRIRGERTRARVSRSSYSGSSPHTRGTLQDGFKGTELKRFIPAYAGNAWGSGWMLAETSVHPRIRGERRFPKSRPSPADGSSPHTRGTLDKDDIWRELLRFIPAYAGNAPWCCNYSACNTVHPRIRGERH